MTTPSAPAPGERTSGGHAPGRPLPDVVSEAERVVSGLTNRGVTARLLGGVGVAAHRHGPVPAALERSFGDIDLVTGRIIASNLLAASSCIVGTTCE